ncbi:unnamed protein product [Clonostachys byssicola]|uniref:NmrA-like domain-containing protein n=1 Tax=Clonostachys byssicola TaxID=160290 RepID=A0A9N9Y7C1_9HYPO|nr:unnamed protein product [Clonostachys byssicola]
MAAFVKQIPRSILVFGASGHIGRPLAEFLAKNAPSISLSLATSSPEKRDTLQSLFPKAHIVQANYTDVASLTKALQGIEGVFVVTPSGTDERTAMTNLVTALSGSKDIIHIVRLVGVFPEFAPQRVPKALIPGGLPYEHPIAKSILDNSGLPVTYLNCGASFIDNLWLQIGPVLERQTFVWPEHRVPFMDPRDIGEIAARLLLSDNSKHIGAFHTMNNGQDWLTFKEVSVILSEVLDQPVGYDGSYEGFVETFGPRIGPVVDTLWAFFKFEETNEENWALNGFSERILGRKPRTVREWIIEHKDKLLEAPKKLQWSGKTV